jgi:hypothetical protein
MDVLSSATFFSSNRGQVASKVGHQPDLFAIRADKSDLRTTPHSATLSCVSQNTPQDIHRAGGAWLVVDACWGSTEKDAKCVAHRPVTQLTHFDLDACVNLLICDDWDVKVDLVAPGVGHAFDGQRSPDLSCGWAIIEFRLQRDASGQYSNPIHPTAPFH